METKNSRNGLWKWLLMHLLFVVYSMTTVISRKIGGAEFLSREFILGYALIFLCLGIYALGWQQVLKSFSLSRAFANKAVVVIWGMVWGYALFGESLTPAKIIGAALIIAGVLFFASEEEQAAEKESDVEKISAGEENAAAQKDLITDRKPVGKETSTPEKGGPRHG